jgi:hypothetical protein
MSIKYQDGQIVFHYDEDTYEVISALKEIFNDTPIGQKYVAGDYVDKNGNDGYEVIVKAAVTIAGGPMISLPILTNALQLLIDSGELRPKKFTKAAPLEEPVEDTRPRSRDGKLLTDSQLKWQEYRQWSETASSSEVNLRKQSDQGYAAYVRKMLEAEFEGVGDGRVPAGAPQGKVVRASNELTQFAHSYNQEPSENLKPRGGFVLLAGEKIPYPRFLELVNAATNARLL